MLSLVVNYLLLLLYVLGGLTKKRCTSQRCCGDVGAVKARLECGRCEVPCAQRKRQRTIIQAGKKAIAKVTITDLGQPINIL